MTRALCAFLLSIPAALLLPACNDCMDTGNNGNVPEAGPGEYTLIVDNGISRDLPVYVDGKQVATVCQETGNVRVGNFPMSSCSKFNVFDEVNQCMAYLTPCGGTLCQEECSTTCFDTAAITDGTMELKIDWKYGS
jgi:hypothetical protein